MQMLLPPSLRQKDSPPISPPNNETKPPEAKKGGKGGRKGKRGKSESRPEKRKQQCIPCPRRTRQKRDYCKREHQVNEAVKRFNDSKAQAKAQAAPKAGAGVIASMIGCSACCESPCH